MSHIVWLLPFLIAGLLIIGSKAGSPARTAGYVILSGLIGWHMSSAFASRDVARLRQKLDLAVYKEQSAIGIAADDRVHAQDATDAAGAAIKSAHLGAISASIRAAIEHSRAARAEAKTKEVEGKVHDLEKKQAHRVVARCPLSSDDARSLRGIAGEEATH